MQQQQREVLPAAACCCLRQAAQTGTGADDATLEIHSVEAARHGDELSSPCRVVHVRLRVRNEARTIFDPAFRRNDDGQTLDLAVQWVTLKKIVASMKQHDATTLTEFAVRASVSGRVRACVRALRACRASASFLVCLCACSWCVVFWCFAGARLNSFKPARWRCVACLLGF